MKCVVCGITPANNQCWNCERKWCNHCANFKRNDMCKNCKKEKGRDKRIENMIYNEIN